MGYKTLVDFKEGLRRTVAWYRTEFTQQPENSAPALA